jgi:hypothetical protein
VRRRVWARIAAATASPLREVSARRARA